MVLEILIDLDARGDRLPLCKVSGKYRDKWESY